MMNKYINATTVLLDCLFFSKKLLNIHNIYIIHLSGGKKNSRYQYE